MRKKQISYRNKATGLSLAEAPLQRQVTTFTKAETKVAKQPAVLAAVVKPEKTLSAAAVEKVVASAEPISQPQPATEPMTPKMEPSTSATTTTGEVPHAVVPMGQDPTATQPNATAESKSRLWLIVAMAAGVALFLYFRKK